MAELKHEKLEVIKVEYFDLETLIEETYGHIFSFQGDEEVGSEDCKFYKITGEVSSYEESSLREFKEDGSGMYMTGLLMQDMCRKGIIEKGNYLIYTI